jgi:DNA polymerase III delta prime subunit
MNDLSIVKKNYINYIDKIILNNKLSHAYLIEIGNYIDDLKYVYDFIKMILCNISYNDICICNDNTISLIDNNNYPDIKIIEPDGLWIKKNQLIELQKDYSNTSLLGKNRIYIIKEAEKLNPSSANTMLKFLEEPEPNIIAILLTDNRYHVIDTILSRCQILTLKENNFIFDNDEEFVDFFESIIKPTNFFIKYNYFVNNYIPDKNIAKEKLIYFENIILYYLNYYYCHDISFNEKLLNYLKYVDKNRLLSYISIIEEEISKLDFNINYKLWLDSLFSKLIGG